MDAKQCSNEFFDAFRSGFGSDCFTCGCGRTYFASLECGWSEDGELERLQQQALVEPDKYIDTGHSGVSTTNLGIEYVHECVCGTERRYEDWIWSHRRAITEYIKARSEKELKAAQDQAKACADL